MLTGRPYMSAAPDREHGDQLGRRALCVGEMRFANLLADRAHDALPADGRAETECLGDRDLDPQRDEVGQRLQLAAELGQRRLVLGIGNRAGLDQLVDAFLDQIDVAAQPGTALGRQLADRLDLAQRRGDRAVLEGEPRPCLRRSACRWSGSVTARRRPRSWLSCRWRRPTVPGPAGGLRGRNDRLDAVGRCTEVQRIRRRHHADQDQHDQAHALLAVVRAVREAHAVQVSTRRARIHSGGGALPSGARYSAGLVMTSLAASQQQGRRRRSR